MPPTTLKPRTNHHGEACRVAGVRQAMELQSRELETTQEREREAVKKIEETRLSGEVALAQLETAKAMEAHSPATLTQP